MNDSQEKIRQLENQSPNTDVKVEENDGAELISGKVSEFARENISENTSETAKSGQQSRAKTEDEVKQEKVDLREKLLEKAPSEKIMIAQITVELTKERTKLEKQLRKAKKPDLFEDTLRALRAVVRQIEELATTGIEALKDLWLKIVLKFS